MKKNNFKINTKLKVPNFLGSQYFILALFWLIFISLLITALTLFLNEKITINARYNISDLEKKQHYATLMNISYPLIDFSLLSFSFFMKKTNTNNYSKEQWTQRLNDINTAYSYLFITILIAIIGLCYYVIIMFKLYRRKKFEKRYKLTTNFANDYVIYDTKIYLNFIINLAIVFSFFNFLSTLIVVIYSTILVLTSYFFWYGLKIKTQILTPHKWWKAPNFVLFTSVLLMQNGFTLLKTFFLNQFNVNLDLILSIILPIGTITVIITLLIKNMLSSQVTAIKTAIKTINNKVNSFQIYFYAQKENVLTDYTFINQLPPLIRISLQTNTINNQQALVLLTTINETIIFFKTHFQKPKELNYMLYHLFNKITSMEEIDEIKSNIIKINNK